MTKTLFEERVAAYAAIVGSKTGRVVDLSLVGEVADEFIALGFDRINVVLPSSVPLILEVWDQYLKSVEFRFDTCDLVAVSNAPEAVDYMAITRSLS